MDVCFLTLWRTKMDKKPNPENINFAIGVISFLIIVATLTAVACGVI